MHSEGYSISVNRKLMIISGEKYQLIDSKVRSFGGLAAQRERR